MHRCSWNFCLCGGRGAFLWVWASHSCRKRCWRQKEVLDSSKELHPQWASPGMLRCDRPPWKGKWALRGCFLSPTLCCHLSWERAMSWGAGGRETSSGQKCRCVPACCVPAYPGKCKAEGKFGLQHRLSQQWECGCCRSLAPGPGRRQSLSMSWQRECACAYTHTRVHTQSTQKSSCSSSPKHCPPMGVRNVNSISISTTAPSI